MDDCIRGRVSGEGRVVLPAELRRALGIRDGDEVIFRRTEHGIQICTLDQAIEAAQEAVRKYMPKGISLVDALHESRQKDTSFD